MQYYFAEGCEPGHFSVNWIVEQINHRKLDKTQTNDDQVLSAGKNIIVVAPKTYENLYFFRILHTPNGIKVIQQAVYYSPGYFSFIDADKFIEDRNHLLLYPITGSESGLSKTVTKYILQGTAEKNSFIQGKFDFMTCKFHDLQKVMSYAWNIIATISLDTNQQQSEYIAPEINRQIFSMPPLFIEPDREDQNDHHEKESESKRSIPSPKIVYDFKDDYTVVDIETTGLDPLKDEITELAAVRVRGNCMIETFEKLVNPGVDIPEDITNLTGITDEMVCNAPRLSEVWDDFVDFIGEDPLVGHNIVHFDVKFLNTKMPEKPIQNRLIDTAMMSKKVLAGNVPDFKLKTIAKCLEVPDDQEHRGLSDAIMTYECYEAMRIYAHKNDIIVESARYKDWKPSDIKPGDSAVPNGPLKGKTFVFTGNSARISRKNAMQLAVDAGGQVKGGVTMKTTHLVVGDMLEESTSKYQKALDLRKAGQEIAIITTDEFIDMLS